MTRQLSMPYLFDHLNTENGTRKNPYLLHLKLVLNSSNVQNLGSVNPG